MSPQEPSTNRASVDTWDPYDVWLKRVKQPRDRVPRRAVVDEPGLESPDDVRTDATHTEGNVLLPGVS